MVETRTRILGIAPYEGMHTAMDRAAQAYPNVQMDVFTGDLDVGVSIVQRMPPNSYDCIISRGGTAELIRRVTDLPVVEVQLSVYDVLSAMKLAEKLFGFICHCRVPQYYGAGAYALRFAEVSSGYSDGSQCRRSHQNSGEAEKGRVPDGGLRHDYPYHC